MPPIVQVAGGVRPKTAPPHDVTPLVVLVPPSGQWWIFVNDRELISDADRADLRAAIRIWIEIRPDEQGAAWGFESR